MFACPLGKVCLKFEVSCTHAFLACQRGHPAAYLKLIACLARFIHAVTPSYPSSFPPPPPEASFSSITPFHIQPPCNFQYAWTKSHSTPTFLLTRSISVCTIAIMAVPMPFISFVHSGTGFIYPPSGEIQHPS